HSASLRDDSTHRLMSRRQLRPNCAAIQHQLQDWQRSHCCVMSSRAFPVRPQVDTRPRFLTQVGNAVDMPALNPTPKLLLGAREQMCRVDKADMRPDYYFRRSATLRRSSDPLTGHQREGLRLERPTTVMPLQLKRIKKS